MIDKSSVLNRMFVDLINDLLYLYFHAMHYKKNIYHFMHLNCSTFCFIGNTPIQFFSNCNNFFRNVY